MVLKFYATKKRLIYFPRSFPCDNWLIQFLAAEVSKNPTNMVRPVKHPKGMQLSHSSSSPSPPQPHIAIGMAYLAVGLQTPTPVGQA